MVELIVFDKDGTLVDLHAPWGQWAQSVAASLAPYIPPERLVSRLGWDTTSSRIAPETPLAIASLTTLQAVIATWLLEAGLGWSEAMVTAARAITETNRSPAPPICLLGALFNTLIARGFELAVVTTDDRAGVEHDLGSLGVVQYLSAVVSGDEEIPTKPAPDMVLRACKAVGTSPARTIVVGDSVADMAMGRAAKVALTIGVLSGGGTAEFLAPYADVLLPTVCELPQLPALGASCEGVADNEGQTGHAEATVTWEEHEL